MRTLRRVVNALLPLLGMILAFGGVLVLEDRFHTLFAVIGGILLIEAGVWKLANPMLPSERRYIELRSEVDDFIDRIRRLNTQALRLRRENTPDEWKLYQEVIDELHESVDRMATLAGKEAEEQPTAPPISPPYPQG